MNGLIQIQKQYERIPSFSCKTGCTDCCGPVPFTVEEWAMLTPEEQAKPLVSERCQFVGESGCTIYDRRPILCRLFGAVEEPRMTCPHGCQPDKKLTAWQGQTIMRYYRQHTHAQNPLEDLSWAQGLLDRAAGKL